MGRNHRKIYDAYSKKILTNKQVVANIMKSCIPEYEKLSMEEKISCLDIDKNDPNSIAVLANDDIEITNSKISYDILFIARLPKSKDKISMYINLEAQNESSVGYPLVTRAIYYASRLISRQKNKTFKKSEYKSIKKVYSIWICTSPKLNQRNTINYYTIKEDCKRGEYKEKKEYYSLINVIMFNLSVKKDYRIDTKDIIDMMEILLTNNDVEPNKKVKILNDNFGIMMSDKEASKMITLSDGIEYEGIQKGIKIGKQEGLLIGKQEGIQETLNKSIKSLYHMGYSKEDIFKMLGLSNEDKDLFTSIIEKYKNI